MKKGMIRIQLFLFMAIAVACNNKSSTRQFKINGTIANSTAKKIYLEEMPAGSSQASIIDSSVLDKDGRYHLKANYKESGMYGLRLDQNKYAVAYVINDAPEFTVNVELNKQNNEYADKYDIKGSPASLAMKNFVASFGSDLQQIYYLSRQADSLKAANAPDSVMSPLIMSWKALTEKVKDYTLTSIKAANDPALIIFELGYYQGTDRGFGLDPISPDQEKAIINDLSTRFPSHQGVAAVKKNIEDREARETMRKKQEEETSKWVGKPAPDFALPDVNGKEVKLSSFKGKFVLVDFWASWCGPCRAENPNVVKAFNQFKDKNFTVLGVSLDKPGQKDKWKEAISQDNLTWTHVSDLQYWNSKIIPLYQFDGIPYNVLVDPQGTIIAEGLRGRDLETKLTEVLK
jgi:peroxiredoxin